MQAEVDAAQSAPAAALVQTPTLAQKLHENCDDPRVVAGTTAEELEARGALLHARSAAADALAKGRQVQQLDPEYLSLLRGDKSAMDIFFPQLDEAQRDRLPPLTGRVRNAFIDVTEGVITAYRFDAAQNQWERAGFSAPAGGTVTEDGAFAAARLRPQSTAPENSATLANAARRARF